jgi:hypothetical protein
MMDSKGLGKLTSAFDPGELIITPYFYNPE